MHLLLLYVHLVPDIYKNLGQPRWSRAVGSDSSDTIRNDTVCRADHGWVLQSGVWDNADDILGRLHELIRDRWKGLSTLLVAIYRGSFSGRYCS